VSDIHDLLGAYCTDSLDQDERADFDAHLATCADCRAEAAQFREVLAALADTSPVHPPSGLEEQVLVHATSGTGQPPAEAPAGTSGTGQRPDAGPRGWARAGSWLAVAAAGALLFAAGVGVGFSQREVEATLTAAATEMAEIVAVASAGDASVQSVDIMGTTSRLVTSAEMDKSVFLASELPTPAKGMCYQLWRVTDDGRMLSAGAFTPDPDGHIAAVLDGGAVGVQKLMITLEPPGGSAHPTGQPLGEVAT
jgi:anti-sigma-K factor RskA